MKTLKFLKEVIQNICFRSKTVFLDLTFLDRGFENLDSGSIFFLKISMDTGFGGFHGGGGEYPGTDYS